MYVPPANRAADDEVAALLEEQVAAELITFSASGLSATLLPFVYEAGSGTDQGIVRAHLARKNPQWRETPLGDAMLVVRGPDAYISPSWYATKREHGRVVPTWNYAVAHVYGRLTVHHDASWLEAHVRRLTDKFERHRPDRWSVDDAPTGFISGQARAIVGLELQVSRIEAKFKLGQNRSVGDLDGVIAGLTDSGESAVAGLMRQVRARNGSK